MRDNISINDFIRKELAAGKCEKDIVDALTNRVSNESNNWKKEREQEAKKKLEQEAKAQKITALRKRVAISLLEYLKEINYIDKWTDEDAENLIVTLKNLETVAKRPNNVFNAFNLFDLFF